MSIVVYPNENYNSWISEEEADTFFESRLRSDEWFESSKEAALVTAFRDLNLIVQLDIDLSSDETPLSVLQIAQCEQALYLVKNDVDFKGVQALSLTPSFFVKLGEREPRICYNAVEILSEYIRMKTISRFR